MPGQTDGGFGERTFDPERVLVTVYLSIRAVIVVVAVAAVATGWRSYRPVWLPVGALILVVGESGWVAARTLARRSVLDPIIAGVEGIVGLVAVLSCALAIPASQRLTALNWGNVFAIVGVAPGVAIAYRRLLPGLISTAILDTAALVLGRVSGAPIERVTTAVYFLGLYGAARYIQRQVRGWGREHERLEALRRAAERDLAVEQERSRQYRVIHDTALQTLEAIGSGISVDDQVRASCLMEAARLRRVLRGEEQEGKLLDALGELVEEYAEQGLQVELTTLWAGPDPSGEVVSALAWATREALRNVRRHSGVGYAVLHLREGDGGAEAVVRDRGRGFDPAAVHGFGVANSIVRRMNEVGGRASIWSAPGKGTRVTMWAPR